MKTQLRYLCGVRCGDKGDISDISLFADDEDTYVAMKTAVTAEGVAEFFGGMVQGPVERYEVDNLMALKFVLHGALGGGASRSLRADNLGKTMGATLLRMEVEVPEHIANRSNRGRAPLPSRL